MMAQRTNYYIRQITKMYNKDYHKHTVLITFVDHKGEWSDRNMKHYRKASPGSSVVVASSENMRLLTADQTLFFKRDWSDECDMKFYADLRDKLCASVINIEKHSKSDAKRMKREMAGKK